MYQMQANGPISCRHLDRQEKVVLKNLFSCCIMGDLIEVYELKRHRSGSHSDPFCHGGNHKDQRAEI